MHNILQDFNQNLTKQQQELLYKFKNLLFFYNKKFNITSITDDEGFYIKHIFDSLAGEKFFKPKANVLEVGSGGGFPSIPLKIVRDDLNFTLVESVKKKCNFLNIVIDELYLKNVKVLNTRAELAANDKIFRERFDAVTARAVAPLSTLCEYCAAFIKIGGKFIAYKTYNESELKESTNACQILGLKHLETFNYKLLKESGERCIYIFEKVNKTPKGYPRGQGKERTKPL